MGSEAVSVFSNPYSTPAQKNAIVKFQQQQALAQALQQQGLTPIDDNNRMMGQIAYKVSPLEGVNKIAQALLGTYGQKEALDNLNSNLNQSSAGNGNAQALGAALQGNGGSQPLPPSLQGIGLAYPEIMAKAQADAYYADHRPGATYRGIDGGVQTAPTDQQLNVASGTPAQTAIQTGAGNALVANAPLGQLPGMAGGQMPQAANGGLPLGNGPMPAQLNQQQVQAALPNVGLQNAPSPSAGIQVSGNAPPMDGGMPQPAAQTAGAQPPAIDPALTSEQNKALLDTWKAGQTATATKAGDNLADSQKTYDVAASALPRAMQRFNEIRLAAKDASSGGGVDEEDPGSRTGDYARNFARSWLGSLLEPKVAQANQTIEQATKQGILSELSAQLQGLKGNKFLEGIASGASGLNLADPSDVKINAVNGLQDQYISNMKSLAEQRRQYGDSNAPTDAQMADMISKYADPSTTISVISPDGKLGRVSPSHLTDLISQGGQLR